MEMEQVLSVLNSSRWTPEKLEEAARGLVQGSCDDPPEAQLKFWWELAQERCGDDTEALESERQSLITQALNGMFGT